MAEKKTELYMEMQMKELENFHSEDKEKQTVTPKKNPHKNEKNAALAKLYEDAAEYEEDLKGFEEELEIVNANTLKDIAATLTQTFPDEDRDYAQELRTILEIGWKHFVEVEKSHPEAQLKIINESDFGDVVKNLTSAYPDYSGDFESDIRGLLVKRWENLIAIKKEHIAEELAEIKTAGLKPKFVQRVYQQYHGLVE